MGPKSRFLHHIASALFPNLPFLQLPSLDFRWSWSSDMSTPAAGRKKNGGTPSGSDAAAAAPGRPLGRGGGLPRSLGHAVGLPPPPRSLRRGGGPALPATRPPTMDGFNGGGFPNFSGGFPFPSSLDGSCGGGFSTSSSLLDAAGGEASSPGSWHTTMIVAHHLKWGNENEHENVIVEKRTEKRIMWNVDEDVRLMSAWIEHSTDSTCGADKGGGQYWGEVVETYNKTTPPLRRRSAKQCKDRWHKINKLTDLFECAYIKARRVFTSGYSNEQWIDAAHKFYLNDNKDNKDAVGPFMMMEVWKICRDVPKWKTYNENLKNARKRKSFHLEADSDENEDTCDETPKRPMGLKQAKMAALAARKGKGSNSSDDGHSKESPIEPDKFDRYSKFQETSNEKRMKLLDRQEKITSDKLEATRVAQLIAQDYKEGKKLEKETKMMETCNNLASQDISSMSDEEKAQRVRMMKKLEMALFPETD
ncbi:unnamed protein product [Urochloa decumbens]|uniref:Myb-like domain-containing protein n=1 Tax=Urochloa decumbens TaxID=240449 RepID=A0ABC9DAY7_9POAL